MSNTAGALAHGETNQQGLTPWTLASLLVGTKLGTGLALAGWVGSEDAFTYLPQTIGYVAVAMTIFMQHRVGLILAFAYTGYILVGGLATAGIGSEYLGPYLSTALLIGAAGWNAAKPEPEMLGKRGLYWTASAVGLAIGVGLAYVWPDVN